MAANGKLPPYILVIKRRDNKRSKAIPITGHGGM
jgi:hypothetical protein